MTYFISHWREKGFDVFERHFKRKCTDTSSLTKFTDVFESVKSDFLYLVKDFKNEDDAFFLDYFFILCAMPYISQVRKVNCELAESTFCHLCQLLNLEKVFLIKNEVEIRKLYLNNTENIQVVKDRMNLTIDLFLFHTTPLAVLKEMDIYELLRFFAYKVEIKNEFDWILFELFPEHISNQEEYNKFDLKKIDFLETVVAVKKYFLTESNYTNPYARVVFEKNDFLFVFDQLFEIGKAMSSKAICLLESDNAINSTVITFISQKVIIKKRVEPRIIELLQKLLFYSTTYTDLTSQLNTSLNTLKNAQTEINKLSKAATGIDIIESKDVKFYKTKSKKDSKKESTKKEYFRYISRDFSVILIR